MYTVGLIDEESALKTHCYSDYTTALKEFKDYKVCFLNNNAVQSRTTISKRNELGEIESIKTIFHLKGFDRVIIFMSKSKNNIY